MLYHEIRALTPVGEIVAAVQMVLGPVFLFLFLLALRNRFRLK